MWAVWSPIRDELLYGALSTSDELQLAAASGHYFYADTLHLVTTSGEPLPFPLSNADLALRPDWTADGRKLAFSMNGQLCILELETEDLTCPLELEPAVENLFVREPVWSADGAWIAFRAQERNELMCDQLYIFEVGTSKLDLVEEGTCYKSAVHWLVSP